MKRLRRLSIFALLILGMCSCADSEVQEILNAHFKAAGGLDRLSEIRTIKRAGDAEVSTMLGTASGIAEEAAVIGKKSYLKVQMVGVAETTVWNGKEGWKTDLINGTVPLAGDELEIAMSAVYVDPLQSLYQQYGNSAFEQGEDEMFNDTACTVLKVYETELVYYLDKTSHLVVGMRTPYRQSDESAATTMVIHYADYEETAGVMLPNTLKVVVGDGTQAEDYTYICKYQTTEIDVALDESIFEKP